MALTSLASWDQPRTTELDNFQVATISPAVDVLIADTFAGNGPLHGRSAEVGSVTWSAQNGAVTYGGWVLDSAAIAGVPFDPTALPGRPTVAVAAGVDPYASVAVSVGFSSQAATAYQVAGQLFVRLKPDGTYAVFADGSLQPLGTIPGSAVNGFHQVEVRYGTATGMGTVRINGTAVFSQALTSVPDIQYAGFHVAGGSYGGTKIDDFRVLANTAP